MMTEVRQSEDIPEGSNDMTKGIEQCFFNFRSPKDHLENSLKCR